MNCFDQGMRIGNTDESATRRHNELVAAAQAGAPGAFAELYGTYSPRLYKTIVSITRNPEDAEDALQETFLRVHLRLHTFQGRSSIYSWLTRIAINTTLMLLRRRRARPETIFDPQPGSQAEALYFEIKDSSPSPEQMCDLHERRALVLRAIRNLAPHLKAPIWMQITLGYSVKQIARTLNISEVAAKTRLHRARRRLFAARDLKISESRQRNIQLDDVNLAQI